MESKIKVITATIILAAAVAVLVSMRSRAKDDPADRQSGETTQPTLVPVAKVIKGPISNQLVISAELRPFQEVDVHAKVAGYVKVIYVDVGDHVKAGQILAILEVPEIDAELKEGEASIRRSRAEISRLRSQVEQAESAHIAAHSNAQRLQDVVKSQPNLVAQQEVDNVVAKDKSLEAEVASNKAGLAAADEQLAVAEANRDRIASLKAFARITAPFDGVVTKRYADTGAMVQAGTASNTQAMPVVRIAENRKLRLSIPVPESAVPSVRLHSPVEVRVDALHRSFRGEVARFADSVDTQTRTMETEVDVDNRQGTLVAGMFASAVLVAQQRSDVLSLPVQAVSRSGSEATALVVSSDNKLQKRILVLGAEDAERIEIISGVQLGEQVVLGVQNQLRPGQEVQPELVEPNPPPNSKS
jgi:RND family efflux transporter MFP subunit